MAARRLIGACVAGVLAPAAALAGQADAATRLIIRGHGFGHGVGMSQWGAYGYATRGADHETILGHYYAGTSLTRISGDHPVRVLISAGRSAVSVTGAARTGAVRLDDSQRYAARPDGTGGVTLVDADGRRVAGTSAGQPLRLAGGGQPVRVLGASGFGVHDGSYRGVVEIRPTLGRLSVVDELDVEDYVRGVVSGESPASWPAQALQAQAVAARTYALTTDAGGSAGGFTQYADTRSQVYTGVTGETAATDAAVAATAHEVVTYQGRLVTTYFFSTSGGQTEDNENSFLGSPPRPWLRSVDDPYDGASPEHTWGPLRFTMTQATRRLRGLVRGKLRTVRVVRRGASPRVVEAELVGSRGTTSVDGPTLRSRLGLFDTWATFRVSGAQADPPADPPAPPPPPPAPDLSGGIAPVLAGAAARVATAAAAAPRPRMHGHFERLAPGRAVRVQRRDPEGWRTVRTVHATAGGRFRLTLPAPGRYRAVAGRDAGPDVLAR